tara:strand:- start:17 stop:232 length:216 start_codon:yes stop_codon:yes gene_type:complete
MAKEVKKKKKSKPKSKKDIKIAQLRDLGDGVLGDDKTLQLLKKLGMTTKQLKDTKSSGLGNRMTIKDLTGR